MKKYSAGIIFVMVFLAACAGPQIKESGSRADDQYLQEMLGTHFYLFKSLDESLFNYNKNNIKFSLKNDKVLRQIEKENIVRKLDSFKYSDNTIFMFEVRHVKPYQIEKTAIISMKDSSGHDVIADVFHVNGQYADGVYFHLWLISLKKPVTKEFYPANELPLIFSADFLKQKKIYNIQP